MLTTAGPTSALATLATNGMPHFVPFTHTAGAAGQKEIPVCVAASTVLFLGTASCCHLVRRVRNLNLVSPSEKKCFLDCWRCLLSFCLYFGPVFLAAGPSSAALLAGRGGGKPTIQQDPGLELGT